MKGVPRSTAIKAAAIVLAIALAGEVVARGGRGGGGGGRGGIAAGGSMGSSRISRGGDRASSARGRAASGDFGRYRDERLERRDDRQEHREERREDLRDYVDEHYDDHDHVYYYGGYYDDGYYYDEGEAAFEEEVFDRLPCTPYMKTIAGTVYYVCRDTWFIRAYVDGGLVYVTVPEPY